ncbi:hypothetical protein GCM10008959_24960 [Deinococcus seoulensis]|uniref:RNA 2',3'-cyclic phosphodiesterase n=1 Tax=Deinococcus seoulensis TaxID=1837379 RepID=A0ABQ2RVU1_9DEIO|nr:RNA 2',3'-cyclic phosphodiesterase [Deinococcus seoulensis]GGR61936.1 hypothetical protein GCM10008959_24960 [Deinococcus seoulensis]
MKIKKTARKPEPAAPQDGRSALQSALAEARQAAQQKGRPRAAAHRKDSPQKKDSREKDSREKTAREQREAGAPRGERPPRPARPGAAKPGGAAGQERGDDNHQPPGTQRLFFALKVPANLAGPIREAQRKLRGNWRNVNADQMHVTLAYLPAVPNDRVDDLKRLGVRLMQDLAPMQVHLRGTGYHPNEGSPRVWFVKVEAEGLTELAQALRDGIHELGLRTDDQPFKGHITLARKKGPAPRVPPLIFTQNWQAGGAVLYRSILRKTGPIYETASTFRFRAPLPTEPTTESITEPTSAEPSTTEPSTAPTTTSPAPQAAPDNQ